MFWKARSSKLLIQNSVEPLPMTDDRYSLSGSKRPYKILNKLIICIFLSQVLQLQAYGSDKIEIDLGYKQGKLIFWDLRSAGNSYSTILFSKSQLTPAIFGLLAELWNKDSNDPNININIYATLGVAADSGNFYNGAGSSLNYSSYALILFGRASKQVFGITIQFGIGLNTAYVSGRGRICPNDTSCRTEDFWDFEIKDIGIGSSFRMEVSHKNILSNKLRAGYTDSSARISRIGNQEYTINPDTYMYFIGYTFEF